MIKSLFYFLVLFSGISLFKGNNTTVNESSSGIFCDNQPPDNVHASFITMNSAVINWTFDPNTPNYVVRFRPVGSNAWSVIFSSSGIGYCALTNLAPCTSYEVYVAKIYNGLTGLPSSMITFTTALNYCAAASAGAEVMHISNVTVTPSGTGLTPMVSNSGASTYTDYRPDPSRKVQLFLGSTNNIISVSKTWQATPGTASVRAWIDFNADGTFQDSEMILVSNSSDSSAVSSSFAVPSTAFQTGSGCGVAMRVIISETYTSPVCGTFTYGEVEDYGVYISEDASLSASETGTVSHASIYPNPASDIIHISDISGNEFEIYNAAGQKISTGKISEQKIDVRHLVKGIYFIQVKHHDKVTRLKLIKK
ncbi:GEVED domain-containing protein [uncultured Chryseobacterium sp.]|uniref:GEVED domain-containing protein n=1 Tax=uncultured Chryseobacterium sp. TaxID=259322 RepID=UPI0025EFE0C7|nr:GEVED domain-containing protein [uncultured Chryseobacterium sp.]